MASGKQFGSRVSPEVSLSHQLMSFLWLPSLSRGLPVLLGSVSIRAFTVPSSSGAVKVILKFLWFLLCYSRFLAQNEQEGEAGILMGVETPPRCRRLPDDSSRPVCVWVCVCVCVCVCVHLCLTLCDPVDCSLPGSSVHGIFWVRILEWVAISYSRGSSPFRDWTCIFCVSCIGSRVLYQPSHQGSSL